MATYPSTQQEWPQEKHQQWAPHEQYYPPQPAPDFPRLPCPLGLNAAFVATRPELLVMQEQVSWGGDQFRVATSDGQDILSMDAKMWSFSKRKEFFSSDGALLFTLRQRLFEMPMSLYIEDASGAEVCAINGNWTFGTKFDVHLANALGGGQPVELAVRGDWADRRAEITWDGAPVAKVRRQFANLRELAGRRTYGVQVAPGVDLALMVAIVVAVDEHKRAQ